MNIIYYQPRTTEKVLISSMSKGYLKNAISHIERTQVGTIFLEALKEELRIKSIIKFKYTETL